MTSRIDADCRVRVARTDVLGTATRWTFTSPDPVSEDPFGHRSVRLRVSEGLVNVGTGHELAGNTDQFTAGSNWLIAGDGHVIDSQTTSPATGSAWGIGALPGGRLLIKLTAYDIASGKATWTGGAVPGSGGQVLLLDGRIIQAGTSALTCIDGRTGKTVWTTPTKQSESDSLVTDGRLVLRAQSTGSGGTVLTAYGVDDGRQRWQTHVADDAWICVIGRRLYARSGQGGLVALG